MRIRGVGEEYSELLEAAGVDTVKELKHRNAANLAARMKEVNDEKKLGSPGARRKLGREVGGTGQDAGADDDLLSGIRRASRVAPACLARPGPVRRSASRLRPGGSRAQPARMGFSAAHRLPFNRMVPIFPFESGAAGAFVPAASPDRLCSGMVRSASHNPRGRPSLRASQIWFSFRDRPAI